MKELLPLIAALTIIAGIAGLGLALVFDATEEAMIEADLQKMRDTIEAVLPAYVNSPDTDDNWVESGDYRFFMARNEAGELVGIAFEVSSREGYGGTVATMVGITPEGIINRIRNLSHRETPGLGSKIKEENFKSQFNDASMENRTFFVAKDDKGTSDKPPIDAITGATISSRAVTNPVGEGLNYYVEHKDEILKAAEEKAQLQPAAPEEQPEGEEQ